MPHFFLPGHGKHLVKKIISAASTNSTLVKSVEGSVAGWYITNINGAVRYVKLYDKATAPTVGTDTPVVTITIPSNSVSGVGTSAFLVTDQELIFINGIGLGITTGAADSDTGAVAANEIIVNLFYV